MDGTRWTKKLFALSKEASDEGQYFIAATLCAMASIMTGRGPFDDEVQEMGRLMVDYSSALLKGSREIDFSAAQEATQP